MEFPVQHIPELKKSNKLQETQRVLAEICLQSLAQNQDLEKFVQGYVRASFLGSLPIEFALRKVVYMLITKHRVLRNSSADLQWEAVCVFGPKNFSGIVAYLDTLPDFFAPKFKRLLIAAEPNEVGTAVLLNSKFVSILGDAEWWAKLKVHSLPVYIVAKRYDCSDDVKQLRMLFPQLSVSRAARLLKGSSVEQASQKLLDDEDAGKTQEKKKFQQFQRKELAPQYEKTLQLAYALLDEDEPEEYDVMDPQTKQDNTLLEMLALIFNLRDDIQVMDDTEATEWPLLVQEWALLSPQQKDNILKNYNKQLWDNRTSDAELKRSSASAYLYDWLVAGRPGLDTEVEKPPPRHTHRKDNRMRSSKGSASHR